MQRLLQVKYPYHQKGDVYSYGEMGLPQVKYTPSEICHQCTCSALDNPRQENNQVLQYIA